MPETDWLRMALLRRTVLVLLSLVLLCAVPFSFSDDFNYEETHHDSRDFVSGGYVHVRMSVGDMHIKRGDSTKIRLEYTVKSHREKNLKAATVDFEVKGNNATIEFHAPSGGNTQFDVELEVPQNTNLDVHEKVGDLTVDSIEGDKDLSLGVGDIRVASGPSGYRVVHASSGIG
ncbi:MAG TPA: hypothetical protein VGS05_14150, partial [Candidatus Sulfotelmatobacter sp.]|nr:hypothetical protein [Candidatus Sulfotelmatobacter sp.]